MGWEREKRKTGKEEEVRAMREEGETLWRMDRLELDCDITWLWQYTMSVVLI